MANHKIDTPNVCCGLMACGMTRMSPTTEHKFPEGSRLTLSSREGQTLYFNGDILTMTSKEPEYVEAIVEKNGKIAFVGKVEEARTQFPEANEYDLQGRTMMPGFFDGHGHMFFTGLVSLMADLMPPPDGPGQDFDALIKACKDYMQTDTGKLVIKDTGWVFGNAYDNSQLTEQAHPDRHVLDKISSDKPVVFIHQSEHLGVVNTKALELLKITKATKDPANGVYQRDADGNPTGVMEEGAFFEIIFGLIGKFGEELGMEAIKKAQELYAHYGYTTVQDGRSTADVTTLLSQSAHDGKLWLDIYAYPDLETNIKAMNSKDYYAKGSTYTNRLRIAGGKVVLDGSPQGKTAWLTQPYLIPPKKRNKDYSGYPVLTDAQVDDLVNTSFSNQWQLILHANGDAAIDQMIRAIDKVMKSDLGYEGHATTLIHGQALRKNQIPELKRLNIHCSLFPAHTFYWGDYHRDSVFGEPRADYLSPCRDVIDAGIPLTTHADSPVIPPNAFRQIDAVVNRVTRSGKVLGKEQCITVYEALLSMTIWSADIFQESDTKGTLEAGKIADLVIMESNPLKIDPTKLHDLKAAATIKDGHLVYNATSQTIK